MTTLVAPNSHCHPTQVTFTTVKGGIRIQHGKVDHVLPADKAKVFFNLLKKGHYVTK